MDQNIIYTCLTGGFLADGRGEENLAAAAADQVVSFNNIGPWHQALGLAFFAFDPSSG